MVPAGYMAKRVSTRPGWLMAPHVADVYSVSGCQSENFGDYINRWKHNGYWLFDSPEIIQTVAKEMGIDLQATSLFYYEVYEKQLDKGEWQSFGPESAFVTKVLPPPTKRLEGFDVVTFWAKTSPECSPLSCNSMAEELRTNQHCLFESFAEAEAALNSGAFKDAEPGPYRIFAVYSVDW
jgi:hypothetical protein